MKERRCRFKLKGNEGETLQVQAQAVDYTPHTGSPNDVQGLKELPFLKGLHLADSNYTPDSRIDILLDMGLSNMPKGRCTTL